MTASMMSSSSSAVRMSRSAPPRNSTPCGMTVAATPLALSTATMCWTNMRSAFLPPSGAQPQRKRLLSACGRGVVLTGQLSNRRAQPGIGVRGVVPAAGIAAHGEADRRSASGKSQLVDVLAAYSNRADLLVDLGAIKHRLAQAVGSTDPDGGRSVHTLAPGFRKQQVAQRLGAVAVAQLVARFEAGTPKHRLAIEYGISESSVKRVIRRHRAQRRADREEVDSEAAS